MILNIKLNLNQVESNLMSSLSTDMFEIDSTQLHNLSTYLELIKKYITPKTIINNHNNILQACNYYSDDMNNYWIIINKQFLFTDICIPNSADLNNINIYENLSPSECELIKSIKDFI